MILFAKIFAKQEKDKKTSDSKTFCVRIQMFVMLNHSLITKFFNRMEPPFFIINSETLLQLKFAYFYFAIFPK